VIKVPMYANVILTRNGMSPSLLYLASGDGISAVSVDHSCKSLQAEFRYI
jgi:hypothetical protein